MVTFTYKKDFPASNEEDFAQARDNFLAKAPQYIIDAILPKVETEAFIDVLLEDKVRWDKKNEDKRTAHDSTRIFKEAHKPVDKITREYKKLTDYNPLITPEARQDLGLYKEEKSDTTNNKRPYLKIKESGGSPLISFTKFPMGGIILFCKTNEGAYDFQTIVKDSKFTDTRPRKDPKLVEIREYYAYYIFKDKKVGKRSEIVQIVLNPIE